MSDETFELTDTTLEETEYYLYTSGDLFDSFASESGELPSTLKAEDVVQSTQKMTERSNPEPGATERLLEKLVSEMGVLRQTVTDQAKVITDLKAERDQQPQGSQNQGSQSQSHVEKPPLPPKYDGCTNFDAYMVQFNAIAEAQHWQSKEVLLLSRLKGKALDVATQGGLMSFDDLVKRLRTHFAPDQADMAARKLETVRKTDEKTWEDLAYEIRNLTAKAYSEADEPLRDRLGVVAFVNAISNDQLRGKVRDGHPKTIQAALDQVRQAEADQVLETQRCHSAKGKVHAVQEESQKLLEMEEKLKELTLRLETRTENKPPPNSNPEAGRVPRPGANRGPNRFNHPRGRGRGFRPQRRCFFCGAPDHFVRDCPHKYWQQHQVQQQSQQQQPSQYYQQRGPWDTQPTQPPQNSNYRWGTSSPHVPNPSFPNHEPTNLN